MNRKQKCIAVLCALSALTASPVSAKTLEFTIGSNDMYISETRVTSETLDAAPYIANDRTMVPLRVISENFGANVIWSAENRTVTIQGENTELILTLDSTSAVLNGETITIDAAPTISNDRTMVPLRVISEALGKSVEYVQPSAQILITDNAPVMTINGQAVTLDDYKFWRYYYGYSAAGSDIATLAPQLTSYLLQANTFADMAVKSDMTGNSSQLNTVTETISQYKDEIYASNALTASAVKALVTNLNASTYVNQLEFTFSEDDIKAAYEDYVCAKHIFLLTTNPETGAALSDAEKADVKKQAEDILKQLKNGADFDTLMNEYCEDPGLASNPDGYIFTKGEMVAEFETAVYAMKEGEISDIVESSFGYHIIKREPLPALDDYRMYVIEQALNNKAFDNYYNQLLESVNIQYNMSEEELIQALTIE